MAESSKKTEKYIPNPFEAATLQELRKPWRFYDSKEEFEKVVAEFSTETFQTEGGEITKWEAARANGLISFGAKLRNYEKDTLDAAEQQIRNDKELWKKVQAAHLYNTAGFKPQIDLADEDEISADDILKRISENLNKIEKGKLVDGKYQPSRAEKAVLRTLGNYGEFIRNPKDEKETAKFYEEIQKRFNKISKREDYQKFEPKQQKKQSQKTERKEKTMSDENKFELSPEQLEFCTTHGITPEEITSKEAFEAKKAEIENAENSEDKEKENKEKQDKENKDKTKEPSEKEDENEEDKKKEAIKVHVGEPHAEDKTNEEVPDWVKRKADYYQHLSDTQQITDYKQDTSKQGFAAEFNNAKIHYTSETEVTVSEDAGYIVFAKMLEEKDNEGRPVEFPENASKEVATRMYAACVLHGNPMQGAVPKELDAETLAKCGLTPEQIEQVNNHLAASQQKNDGQQKNGEEKTGEKENPEEIKQRIKESLNNATRLGATPPVHMAGYGVGGGNPVEIKPDEDVKPLTGKEREEFIEKLSTQQLSDILDNAVLEKDLASEVKQIITTKAINEQTQAKEELHQMIKDGKVSLVKDEKTGKVEMTANDQKDLKRALLLTANIKSTQEASLKANGNNNEQYRQQQIANLRSRLNPEQAKSRQEKEDARDLVMAARLGIAPKDAKVTDRNGQEVQAKTGEDLKKYQSNLSKETMARLTQKFKGAEK